MSGPAFKVSLRMVGVIAWVLAFSCLCADVSAQQKTIWEIGKFDSSSGEFRSQGIDYSKKESDAVYRVGKSKDSEDWPRFQPGPANGMAGGRVHPFTILFMLPEKPAGALRQLAELPIPQCGGFASGPAHDNAARAVLEMKVHQPGPGLEIDTPVRTHRRHDGHQAA